MPGVGQCSCAAPWLRRKLTRQGDLSQHTVRAQFQHLSDMGGIGQIGKEAEVVWRAEEEEETAGGDAHHAGIVSPDDEANTAEDWQQADQHQREDEDMGGGHTDEPGGAEGVEGHGIVWDGGGDVLR